MSKVEAEAEGEGGESESSTNQIQEQIQTLESELDDIKKWQTLMNPITKYI